MHLLKVDKKFGQYPQPPLIWTKSKRKATFFRETVPKSLKVFCCFTCYYWHNIHSPNQLFWLVVDLNKDKIPKGRAPKKTHSLLGIAQIGVRPPTEIDFDTF